MQDREVQRIVDASGFCRKEVPFKYLGIPVCAKRISSKECSILADKMTARIKAWSTRNLSFAGRAVLINSVLLTIHSYWSQVMILPKKVLNGIEAICRAYLWRGQHMFQGAGLIAWDSVCQSKAAGGISFKKVAEWNNAAIIKYVWAIAKKEDNLWVRWIHSVYNKGEDWWSYQAPTHGSWYWRKLVAVKEQVKSIIDMQQFAGARYQISRGYKLLCPIQNKVKWSQEVWGRLNLPRHSFVLWVAIQNRLRTREKLQKHNVIVESHCLFCRIQTETEEHLFFDCSFSLICLQQVKSWLQWRAESRSLGRLLRWIERAKISRFKKQIFSAAIAALVYQIWHARNDILWNSNVVKEELIVRKVKEDVKCRVSCVWPKNVSSVDIEWFSKL
ncbi:uncharacterized protein LOC133815290 [Humulus lupulus]|uniref:uncharacterized protein LOC133815290 n=1 Tax=Humulus lupulus TaxID=3486 RepID=UPI002B41692A|nr:uncharacterized protein LOC133815290 [Humulus lupulus]